jgi:hypothetical protein
MLPKSVADPLGSMRQTVSDTVISLVDSANRL